MNPKDTLSAINPYLLKRRFKSNPTALEGELLEQGLTSISMEIFFTRALREDKQRLMLALLLSKEKVGYQKLEEINHAPYFSFDTNTFAYLRKERWCNIFSVN